MSGFVPSLKKDGPLTVFDINRLARRAGREEGNGARGRTQEATHRRDDGHSLEKWEPIELQAQELQKERKAVKGLRFGA